MFDSPFSDPALIPITLVYVVLVAVAFWLKQKNAVILLSIVFSVYLVISIFKEPGQTQEEQSATSVLLSVPGDTTASRDTLTAVPVEESTVQDTIPEPIAAPVVAPAQLPVQDETEILRVRTLVMSESVDEQLRKPINRGRAFPLTVGKVYCFTGIQNRGDKQPISHVWSREGQFMSKITMSIGHSDHWRAWSFITLRDGSLGNWKVSIVDSNNTVLDTIHFQIVAPDKE